MLGFSHRGVDLELLLNLCWLLLFGPGIYVWLRQRHKARSVVQFSIPLASFLFLLFPVISVTDDLHAMRQEMEEPGPSKRALKQVAKRTQGPDLSAASARPAPTTQFWSSLQFCGTVAAAPVAAIAPAL